MKRLVKNAFRKVGIEITKTQRDSNDDKTKIVSLTSKKGFKGNVLLSYIIAPFLLPEGETIPNAHTNYWESWQIAHTFLDLGYNVDVIHYLNATFIPEKEYSFFIDARRNLERLAPLLNNDCVKIMHIDTAHWLFHNTAQMNRLLSLQQRKGIAIAPRKAIAPNWGIEHADCATILGNDFTISTFSYAQKPIYRVPISCPNFYPWPEAKNFDAYRKNFVWFNSGGLVHKGLDLVLDAFAEMPEYNLFIMGPIDQEKDFQKVFSKELYQTPNIHTIGWIDINSSKFLEITNSCVGVILPSCSEGQSGSVVTCLHAGLIPVISYESGVDVHDFGFILKNCSIEEIQDSVRVVSGLDSRELKLRARKAWEFARANHSREKFMIEYRKIVDTIIATREKKQISA
jgi:glycosyltransferase involved in cell wall biosynthesis